jgi:hypothetical protein
MDDLNCVFFRQYFVKTEIDYIYVNECKASEWKKIFYRLTDFLKFDPYDKH